MMVSKEAERTTLRKDRGLIVDRSILEMEEQAGGDPIAAHHLVEVTHSEDAALL
jgi:hypothetical protein